MTNRRTKAKKQPVTTTLKKLGLKLKYPAPRVRAKQIITTTAKKTQKQKILLPPTLTSQEYPLLTTKKMSTKKTESENTTDTDEVQLYDEGEPLASAESDNEEYSTSTNTKVDNKLAKKTTKLMTTPATMATSVHNEQEKKIQSGFAQALTQSSSTSKVSMQRDSSKKRGNETMPPAPATSTTSKTNTASTKPVNTTNGSEQKSIYYRLGDEQKARDTKALQEEAKKEKEVEELKASLKEKTALLKGQASTLEQKQKLLAEQEARIALLEEQMLQRKNAEPTPVPLPAKGNATSKKEEHMTVDHNDTYKGMQKTSNSNSSSFDRPHFSKNKHNGEHTHTYRSASANGDARSSSKEKSEREYVYMHRDRSYSIARP